jgi:hypothetical protein
MGGGAGQVAAAGGFDGTGGEAQEPTAAERVSVARVCGAFRGS